MHRNILVIIFILTGQLLWCQYGSSTYLGQDIPEGTFVITSAGFLEFSGDITMKTGRKDIGDKIYIDKNSVTLYGHKGIVIDSNHWQCTERQMRQFWAGAGRDGQRSFTFDDIGFKGKKIDAYDIDYNFDSIRDVANNDYYPCIAIIYKITKFEYLFIHGHDFLFVKKIANDTDN
jgi:hypothetical protein